MSELVFENRYYEIDTHIEKKEMEKQINFSFLLDVWMSNIENNKNVRVYFENKGYTNIAIYGMGILGKHLKRQLEDTYVNCLYYIDHDTIYYNDLEIKLDDIKSIGISLDVIVVTPIMEYKEIKKKLSKICDFNIASIEEVILSV